MEQKNNMVIAFTKDAESALLDIEKKYSLEDGDEEALKKFKENKPSKINVVANLIREFVKKNLSEQGFISALQKDLKINKETGGKILKDAANSIIPFLIKTSEEEIEKGAYKNPDNNNKLTQPISVESTRLRQEKKPINNIPYAATKLKEDIKKMNPLEKITKRDTIRKNIQEIERPVPVKKEYIKKGADTYREPIE